MHKNRQLLFEYFIWMYEVFDAVNYAYVSLYYENIHLNFFPYFMIIYVQLKC